MHYARSVWLGLLLLLGLWEVRVRRNGSSSTNYSKTLVRLKDRRSCTLARDCPQPPNLLKLLRTEEGYFMDMPCHIMLLFAIPKTRAKPSQGLSILGAASLTLHLLMLGH